MVFGQLAFFNNLPFNLTNAQIRVLREIHQDLEKDLPMLRLVQGDVGSGKTMIALLGCCRAYRLLDHKQL